MDGGPLRPKTIKITNSTKNTKKSILAIPTAAPAIPPKPRIAAMIAITRNVIAQPSIMLLLL